MRIHPICLLLVAAVAAAEAAISTNVIKGCKFDEEVSIARTLKVRDCDSPLTLTKDALKAVSKKISVISFRNVVIRRIDKDAFAGFDELESVVIEDATIDSIDPMAFYLPELGTITFTKTTFGESPNLSSEYLEELIFNDCKLTQVPNLDNLPALNFLSLANNFIEEIDEDTFSKVENLEEVTLSNNSITKLPPNLFIGNRDFSVLNLGYNPLTSFELNFDSQLEFLSLQHCKLSSLDRRTTENLNQLSSLDLSGNELSVLAIDTFEPMKELNTLNLSNNKLVELDDDIFLENSKLDKIILDNNNFETLPKFQTKGKVFETHTFSCRNCALKSVKGAFDSMTDLKILDLSNNHLNDIEGLFSEMRSLKDLSLSNNQITTIGINSFPKDTALENLDLSSNPLQPLDPVFLASIPSLKKLNVSSSDLKKLWTNHNAVLPSLEQLFVDKNQLSVIKVEDMTIIPKLKLIDLEENPLSCTQDLYDLVSYLTKRAISPKISGVKTHEELQTDSELVYSPKRNWQSVLPSDCPWDFDVDTDNELTDDDTEDGDDQAYDEEYDEDKEEAVVEASVLNTSGFNLAKASYILSITSVFILTALLVLFVAVVVTLMILKRNKSFNMHNGNLPRLKIPLWHTTLGQKKHSGSVYKPLSEDLSGSRTPIINRYEFKQTPQVHNLNF